MTHKILKSSILPYPGTLTDAQKAFAALVDAHIAELSTWHGHDVKARAEPPKRAKPEWRDFHKPPVVTAGLTNADKTAAHLHANKAATNRWAKAHTDWQKEMMARHEPYPRPAVHPDVDAAVKTTVNSDGSTTFSSDFEIVNDDPTPDAVLAEKKLALLQKIAEVETAALDRVQLPLGRRRLANMQETAIRNADLALWATITKGMAPEDIEKLDVDAALAKARDPVDTQHLADQESRRQAVDAIMQKGAQAMSDVEDLTLDNVDNYQVPDFG
jgi:hypothetical protein